MTRTLVSLWVTSGTGDGRGWGRTKEGGQRTSLRSSRETRVQDSPSLQNTLTIFPRQDQREKGRYGQGRPRGRLIFLLVLDASP